MIIPLQALPKLRIDLKKKLSLYVLFAAGSFAMVASILRAAMSIKNPASISPVLLWSTVEETVATLVANGPILKALVFRGQSFGSSNTSTHGTSGYTRDRSTHDVYEMKPKGNGFTSVVTSSKGQGKGDSSCDDTLMVMRTVEVTVQSEKLDEDASSSESSRWVP